MIVLIGTQSGHPSMKPLAEKSTPDKKWAVFQEVRRGVLVKKRKGGFPYFCVFDVDVEMSLAFKIVEDTPRLPATEYLVVPGKVAGDMEF